MLQNSQYNSSIKITINGSWWHSEGGAPQQGHVVPGQQDGQSLPGDLLFLLEKLSIPVMWLSQGFKKRNIDIVEFYRFSTILKICFKCIGFLASSGSSKLHQFSKFV